MNKKIIKTIILSLVISTALIVIPKTDFAVVSTAKIGDEKSAGILDSSNTLVPLKTSGLTIMSTKIDLIQVDRTVPMGTNLQLNAIIFPSNATNKKVTWSSSNSQVVRVSSSGVVHGLKPGIVTITAKTSNNKIDTCIIRVNIPAKSISINKSSTTISKGKTEKLSVNFNPTNTTSKEIKWESLNPTIATVSSSGVVTAKAIGTATIRATSKYGKIATCKVKVINQIYPENDKISVGGKIITRGQYANFRNVQTGNIAPGVLYRCINPILPYSSKQNEPAYQANKLLEAHGVNIVLSLSDSIASMKSNGYYKSTYYKKLLNSGKVYVRKLVDNGTYDTIAQKKNIVNGLRVIVNNKGPYAIHCKWGQGRTGMVIMLLECLMGSSYDYMYKDFTTTFKNFNLVGRNTSSSSYNREFSKYMRCITGRSPANSSSPKASDWKNVNFVKCAENFLRAGGMTNTEIKTLKNRLAGL